MENRVILKVNVKTTATGCEFINESAKKTIGRVCAMYGMKSRYYSVYYGDGSTTDFSNTSITYKNAMKWMKYRIKDTLQRFGVGVEFVNVDGE